MPWAAISGCSLRYQVASNTCANLLSGNNKGSLLICDRRSQLRTALLSGKFETRATVEGPPSRRRNRILFANSRDTDSCYTALEFKYSPKPKRDLFCRCVLRKKCAAYLL